MVFLMKNYSDALQLNIGCGKDLSIRELAETVAGVVGFEGELVFDASKPDGTPRKLLDTKRLRELGWADKTTFKDGLKKSYAWFVETIS